MRGNLCAAYLRLPLSGSIPAHAGQPAAPALSCAVRQVYPRACGATNDTNDRIEKWAGLSPRMRGNRFQPLGVGVRTRSIPAHAGQPCQSRCP